MMRRYAERCGADFFCLSTGIDGLWPGYAKLKLGALFDRYDRMTFIDGDILVSPTAPNLFDEVRHVNDIGATCIHQVQTFTKREVAQLQQVFGEVPWDGSYFNAGLMVLSRQHRAVLDDALDAAPARDAFAKTQREKCFEDQSLLNYFARKHGVVVRDLGYQFNHTRAFTLNGGQHRYHSHFIHCAGHKGHRRGSRLDQMRKDAEVLQSPKRFSFLKGFPAVAWMLDRI